MTDKITCPALDHCIPCNDGYECVDRATIEAWEREHGKFDESRVTMPSIHELKPGEKGPLEWRIVYTLNRRNVAYPWRRLDNTSKPLDWART